jgi:hypothetical protein
MNARDSMEPNPDNLKLTLRFIENVKSGQLGPISKADVPLPARRDEPETISEDETVLISFSN